MIIPKEADMTLTADSLLDIIDALRIGIAVVDENNRIVLMNRLFGEMVQQNPQERTGTSVFNCHPSESKSAVERMISDLRHKTIDHAEAWINFRGRILYEYLYPIEDRDGHLIGIADELHDAADQYEYMRKLGISKELPISGLGERMPGNTEG
jgi:PAS domain S-box-containing protein